MDWQTYEWTSDKYLLIHPAYIIYHFTNSYLSTNTPTWHLPTCHAYRAEAKLTWPSWPGKMTLAKLTDMDSTQTQGQYIEDI